MQQSLNEANAASEAASVRERASGGEADQRPPNERTNGPVPNGKMEGRGRATAEKALPFQPRPFSSRTPRPARSLRSFICLYLSLLHLERDAWSRDVILMTSFLLPFCHSVFSSRGRVFLSSDNEFFTSLLFHFLLNRTQYR